jgi:hypothetical protein
MAETGPIFKEGILPRLLLQRSRSSELASGRGAPVGQSGSGGDPALPEVHGQNTSVQQQIRSQGLSINRICNSVTGLHDSMAELKTAFTALRLELNTSNQYPQEQNRMESSCDMLKAVFKELRAKVEEIDRLKLENEALQLKNRLLEERNTRPSPTAASLLDTRVPVERDSSDFLGNSRKRPWPGGVTVSPSPQMVASLGNGNEIFDGASLDQVVTRFMKTPLKEVDDTPVVSDLGTASESEIQMKSDSNRTGTNAMTVSQPYVQFPAMKRLRLSINDDSQAQIVIDQEDKKPGQRGKPFGRAEGRDQNSKQALLTEQAVSVRSNDQPVEEDVTMNPTEERSQPFKDVPSRNRARRPRPSAKGGIASSRTNGAGRQTVDPLQSSSDTTINLEIGTTNTQLKGGPKAANDDALEPPLSKSDQQTGQNTREMRATRLSARDALVKLVMQREEAMATEE